MTIQFTQHNDMLPLMQTYLQRIVIVFHFNYLYFSVFFRFYFCLIMDNA